VGARHRARERALQCLYQWESTAAPIDTVLERFWRAQEEPEETRRFAERLVRGTVSLVEPIDELIAEQAANWRLDRMGMVDRNILRLGAYELLREEDTPAAVAIDEAIELAKRFSGDEAGQFVNGILDAIRRRQEAGETLIEEEWLTEESNEAEA
jgi:N utilization substance protein B